MSDKRRKQRELFHCLLELSWKDAAGVARTLSVHAIDLSKSGVRVESSEPIQPQTDVYVRAERYGVTTIARVPDIQNQGYFAKTDFHLDLEAGTCRCPNQQQTRDFRAAKNLSRSARFASAPHMTATRPLNFTCARSGR